MYGPLEPTNIRWGSAEQNKREDFALFGEATFNITDQWKLLFGARWYDVSIDRTYTRNIPATGPGFVVTPSGGDDGVLPKLGFQYFFKEDRMFYALYSEGFRSGGINRARGNPTLPIQYKSDLLNNYEAGLKSRWLGGTLQFNLIGYHQVWKDMQLELVDPSYWCCDEPYQTVLANVGDAVVDGMDVELSWLATDNWSLGLIGTYLFKAEIDEDVSVFDDRSPDDVVLEIPAGTQLPLSSDLNVAAYSQYDWPVDWLGGGEVFLRLQYSHTGESWNRLVDADGDPEGTGYGGRVQSPSYSLWDLRAGFIGANWEFMGYVDNLGDERPVVYHDTNADVFWGRDTYRTSRPRTFGVNLRRYFR